MPFRERSVNVGLFKKPFVFLLNGIYKKGIQTNVKKAKRRRNQRHTPLDFAISFIGQFIF